MLESSLKECKGNHININELNSTKFGEKRHNKTGWFNSEEQPAQDALNFYFFNTEEYILLKHMNTQQAHG